MEWPHDPDGDEGSEGRRKYGMAIFAKKVTEEAFPLAISDFADEVGNHPIRINHEKVVPASQILEHVDVETINSLEAFHRAIGRAMRAGDFWELYPEQ